MSEPASGDLARLIDLIESKALPILERIALALERAPVSALAPASPSPDDYHRALAEGRWGDAEVFARDSPGLSEEFERARSAALGNFRDRVDAACRANDPGGAMAARDELARILSGDDLKAVNLPLAKWLMALVHRRLRAGTIRPDLVELAGQVADRFGGTTEGASLRASLPTLRRSAGLCPRCAEPYTGVADACPKCLASAGIETTTIDHEPEPEFATEEEETFGEEVDLNNDRFWQIP